MVGGKKSGQKFPGFRADEVFSFPGVACVGYSEVLEEELKMVVGEVATLFLFMPVLAVLVSCWFLVT